MSFMLNQSRDHPSLHATDVPEGNGLASYIVLTLQIAGLAPVLYTALIPSPAAASASDSRASIDNDGVKRVRVAPVEGEAPMAPTACASCMASFVPPLVILLLNCLLPLICAFTWDKTSVVGGSRALFVSATMAESNEPVCLTAHLFLVYAQRMRLRFLSSPFCLELRRVQARSCA